jgi:signal peptidase I
MSRGGIHAARCVAWLALVAVLAGLVVALSGSRPYRVVGGSMAPGLREGDRVLAQARPARIWRSDIVVVRDPYGDTLIKRIAGLPGETMPDGAVLGPGEYYVLGDAGGDSLDSRAFGPIRREDVLGRAFVRFWPPSRAGRLVPAG